MGGRRVLTCCVLSTLCLCIVEGKIKPRKFPKKFIFGVSSGAYQTEGAWDKDGKGISIWDKACHRKLSPIIDQSNGDEAADSYNQYQRDIDLMADIGIQANKFSISWPRILPTGFSHRINEEGVEHYNKIIDAMLSKSIEPFVTMYHWDLPEPLQRLGGWVNHNIVNWFVDYAKVLLDKYGGKIKYWITINDPKAICSGYGSAAKAPFIKMDGVGEYICAKNVLLAHAGAYQLYENYRKNFNGSMGIAINASWFVQASSNFEDLAAVVDATMFDWGLYVHPVYTGDFPKEVKHNIAQKSAEQGFARSRLPKLSVAEKNNLRRSVDFLGLNHYSTKIVYRDPSLEEMYPSPSYLDDQNVVLTKDSTWIQSPVSWIHEVPWGLRKLLMELKKSYNNPPIFITENGWPSNDGLLDDSRIRYMRNYLSAVLDALHEECNVKGYFYYSLTDKFEWTEGYTQKFGLFDVDFVHPERTRTARKSAYVYKQIILTHALDLQFEPLYSAVRPEEKKNETEANDVF